MVAASLTPRGAARKGIHLKPIKYFLPSGTIFTTDTLKITDPTEKS
jgi:hypothetical protein